MSNTITIPVKYIDTTKYIVKVMQDWMYDNFEEFTDSFEVVQFCDNDFTSYRKIDEYCTENGKLAPSIQAKIRAGKIFSFTYNRYSNCDGGFYRYPSNETDPEKIDGFIIFHPEVGKGASYSERQEMAKDFLNMYTEWANGEIYTVTIETESGRDIDICGGFIGTQAVKDYIKDTIYDAEYTAIGVYQDSGLTYDITL